MFFITQVEPQKDGTFITQCRGYFSNFDDAEYRVVNNITDFWETCFDYIVIENTPEGLYQSPLAVAWYKYNKELDKYQKINPPQFAKNISGFALG